MCQTVRQHNLSSTLFHFKNNENSNGNKTKSYIAVYYLPYLISQICITIYWQIT